jgi:hypothetical protein
MLELNLSNLPNDHQILQIQIRYITTFGTNLSSYFTKAREKPFSPWSHFNGELKTCHLSYQKIITGQPLNSVKAD